MFQCSWCQRVTVTAYHTDSSKRSVWEVPIKYCFNSPGGREKFTPFWIDSWNVILGSTQLLVLQANTFLQIPLVQWSNCHPSPGLTPPKMSLWEVPHNCCVASKQTVSLDPFLEWTNQDAILESVICVSLLESRHTLSCLFLNQDGKQGCTVGTPHQNSVLKRKIVVCQEMTPSDQISFFLSMPVSSLESILVERSVFIDSAWGAPGWMQQSLFRTETGFKPEAVENKVLRA